MAAIRETVGSDGGAVLALEAGADLLCIGNPTNPGEAALPDQDRRDFLAARDGIVAALRDGSLSRERVEEAAATGRGARRRSCAPPRTGTRTTPRTSTPPRSSGVPSRSSGDAPTAASELAVVDARRRSSLAVDSAAGYVSGALAADGYRVRLDVASNPVAEQDGCSTRSPRQPGPRCC